MGGDGFTDEVYLTEYADFADFYGRSLLLLGTKTIGSMSLSHTTKGDILESYDRVFVSQTTQISQIFFWKKFVGAKVTKGYGDD